MLRRNFLLQMGAWAGMTGLSIAGCTPIATTTATPGTSSGKRNHDIDINVDATLTHLYETVRGSRELVRKANGVLVFPSVIAAGLVIGGQYGEGALHIQNKPSGYYSLASLSVGLQIGAQSKAIIFLFMTADALDRFRKSENWSAGADASVALLKVGANGDLDLSTANAPVDAFVLTNAGLMANLTLEGTKISRLKIQ